MKSLGGDLNPTGLGSLRKKRRSERAITQRTYGGDARWGICRHLGLNTSSLWSCKRTSKCLLGKPLGPACTAEQSPRASDSPQGWMVDGETRGRLRAEGNSTQTLGPLPGPSWGLEGIPRGGSMSRAMLKAPSWSLLMKGERSRNCKAGPGRGGISSDVWEKHGERQHHGLNLTHLFVFLVPEL